MLVKAAPRVRVPVEGSPHRYIEDTPVNVDATTYYRRRMADGDLIPVGTSPDDSAAKPPLPAADLAGATAPTASPKEASATPDATTKATPVTKEASNDQR